VFEAKAKASGLRGQGQGQTFLRPRPQGRGQSLKTLSPILGSYMKKICHQRPSLRLHTTFPVFLLTAISDPSSVDKNSTESCGTNAVFYK